MTFAGTFSTDCLPGAAAPTLALPLAAADSNGYESGKWHVLAGPQTESGVAITPSTALTHGPVFGGVNLIAGDIGQLPWHKMVRTGRNREKDRAHSVELLLRTRPNPWQTWSVWAETMAAWAVLWGNGISLPWWSGGRLVGVYPLLPDRTGYVKEDGEYWVWTWINEEMHWFRPDELFHLRGLATNGFWGQSFTTVCRNVLGHGLALRQHGNSMWRNGARPSVAVRLKKPLSNDARAQFRKEWEERHAGVGNDGSVVLLQEDAEIQQYSISNVDAQWLEAVKLDPVHVAVLLQIPPYMLGALENSAVRANLEDQTRGYFQRSLGRHLNKFNEQARLTFLTDREIRSVDPFHYFRFTVEAFLKGDTKTRFGAYQVAVTSRILSPNECREMEDLNPYEGGDEYLNPAIDLAGGGQGGGDGGDGEKGDGAKGSLDTEKISIVLQRLYLAVVNGVISANEARGIAEAAGASLPPLPGEIGDEIRLAKAQGPADPPDDVDDVDEDEPPATDDQRDEALRNLVRAQCDALCQFEVNKLAWAAKQPKDFLAWVDAFYAGTFAEVAAQKLEHTAALAAMLNRGGAWEDAVGKHAARSKAEIEGRVRAATNANELPGLVETETPFITARAEVMTRRILGEDDAD